MRRIEMSIVRQILKLKVNLNLSTREIASSINRSKSTVASILKRAEQTGLRFEELLALKDKILVAKIFPPAPEKSKVVEPNLEYIYRELKKPGVTLVLLWEEYKQKHPGGLMYTQFCERYRDFKKANRITMRKEHKAGEEMEVDWAGQTIPYKDPAARTSKKAYIFVAVLPATSYPFVRAYENMKLENWIDAHIRAFEFFGGTPQILIPDNTKTAILKADRYEPDPNRTYAEMAAHYKIAVVPARAGKPKDKGADEGMVKITAQRIMAPLRNEQFFGVNEINQALEVERDKLIKRPFQKLPSNRLEAFQSIEKPALGKLPNTRYEYAEWYDARVGSDYHVRFKDCYYSVPSHYSNQMVALRVTGKTIEFFHNYERIGSHPINKDTGLRRFSTNPEHMPDEHKAVLRHPTEYYLKWASSIGPNARKFIEQVINQKQFPQEAHKACQAILNTCNEVANPEAEELFLQACKKGVFSYKYFKMFSGSFFEQKEAKPEVGKIISHDNIRGNRLMTGGDHHS